MSRRENLGLNMMGVNSTKRVAENTGEKHKKRAPFLQFYSENNKEEEEEKVYCIEKWGNSIDRQLLFVELMYIYCYHIPDNLYLTLFKVITCLISTTFLLLEHERKDERLLSYIRMGLVVSYSYIISIITLYFARYHANKRHNYETTFNMIATSWYYINAFAFVISLVPMIALILVLRLWTIYYYIFFISVGLILLTDSLGLSFINVLIIIAILFESTIFYGIKFSCGRCCIKRIIPGVDSPPELYLRKHEQEIGTEGERKNCPICLCVLREGQYVVYMPCGEAHIFHRHCIAVWLQQNNICPTCRAEFEYQNDVSRISDPSTVFQQPLHNKPIKYNISDLHNVVNMNPTRSMPSEEEKKIEQLVTLEKLTLNNKLSNNSSLSSNKHSLFHGQLFKYNTSGNYIYI